MGSRMGTEPGTAMEPGTGNGTGSRELEWEWEQ